MQDINSAVDNPLEISVSDAAPELTDGTSYLHSRTLAADGRVADTTSLVDSDLTEAKRATDATGRLPH